jgi:hypothetical protein
VDRVLIAAGLMVIAVAIAMVLRRRRPEPPTQPRWEVPTQLDRDDFPRADADWLVVVFSSATCDSCERATAKAAVLESEQVAYVEVPYQERKDLHERYSVDVVPLIAVADLDGVVRASFVGVPTATDLWAAVAETREPGSSPEPDLGRLEGTSD